MKLSIIVPVYNVADYLAKCLDSLLAQDLLQNEYEIIVVNDGSTDNSEDIAQQYADKYANITLINQANQGLSGARNTGIKHAKGEYIQFVDSDDYLEENVLGGLMKQVEEDNLDVLRFNYQNVNDNYEIFRPYKTKHEDINDYSTQVITGNEYLRKNIYGGCYAVMFIIRYKILNTCFFEEGIYGEDTEWMPRMMLAANRVASTSEIVYNYLLRNGSITNPVTIEKKKKILDDELYVISKLQQTSKSAESNEWFVYKISDIVRCILSFVATDCFSLRKYYISKIKKMNILPLSGRNLKGKLLIKYKLINFSPLLYVVLMHLLYGKK